MHSCKAADFTFSLSVADAVDPLEVVPLLLALRRHAIGNVEGTAAVLPPPNIPGATPTRKLVPSHRRALARWAGCRRSRRLFR
jgi:hypothetical protein